jgi:hypothetical protein
MIFGSLGAINLQLLVITKADPGGCYMVTLIIGNTFDTTAALNTNAGITGSKIVSG